MPTIAIAIIIAIPMPMMSIELSIGSGISTLSGVPGAGPTVTAVAADELP